MLDNICVLCYNTQALRECSFEYRGVEQLEARRAHNPEVVGSSPASATIKTPDFDKKSGVFLTCKNGAIKNAVGDSRGDSSEKCFFRKPGILNFFPVFCFPDFLLFSRKNRA